MENTLELQVIDHGPEEPSWRIELDPRYSKRWRPRLSLQADVLADLAEHGVTVVQVTGGIPAGVIGAYEMLRATVKDEPLPELLVTRALPEPEPTDGERWMASTRPYDPKKNFGIGGMNRGEQAAANRALEAFRNGNVLIIASLTSAEHVEDRALIAACNEAVSFHLEHAEPPSEPTPTGTITTTIDYDLGEHPPLAPVSVHFRAGEEKPDVEEMRYFVGGAGTGFSFRYAPYYQPTQWSADYRGVVDYTPTTATIAALREDGACHFAFGRDRLKLAMVMAMAMGKAPRDRRDVDAWFGEVTGEPAQIPGP